MASTEARVSEVEIRVLGGEAYLAMRIELLARGEARPVLHYMVPCADMSKLFKFMKVESLDGLKTAA